eukprot:1056643-Amphidinium_carterae.1
MASTMSPLAVRGQESLRSGHEGQVWSNLEWWSSHYHRWHIHLGDKVRRWFCCDGGRCRGDHLLVVKFFENSGGAGVIFRYSGPDTNDEEVVVPSTVLITPAGVTPPTTTTTTL